METSKQKAIREACGVHYSHDIDENGFRIYLEIDAHQLNQWVGDYWEKGFNEISKKYWVRPKSLQGIETNNGWVRIESEADLPNIKDELILFRNKDGFVTTWQSGDVLENPKYYLRYSHYKIKEKDLPPIY